MKNFIANLKLFFKTYPIAKGFVLSQVDSKYIGVVRMQICYNQTRNSLVKLGLVEKDITGAIIYLAISFAYLLNVKPKS
jgi:hypothetical protein